MGKFTVPLILVMLCLSLTYSVPFINNAKLGLSTPVKKQEQPEGFLKGIDWSSMFDGAYEIILNEFKSNPYYHRLIKREGGKQPSQDIKRKMGIP